MIYNVIRTAWAHRGVRMSVAVFLALLGVWLRLRSLPHEGFFGNYPLTPSNLKSRI